MTPFPPLGTYQPEDSQHSDSLMAESDIMKFLVIIVLIILSISTLAPATPPEQTEQIQQLQQQNQKQQSELQQLKSELTQLTQRNNQLQQKIKQAPKAPRQNTATPSKKTKVKPVPTSAPKQSNKKGYSLRFSDDQALLTLAKAKQITLIAQTKQQSYIAHWQRQQFTFQTMQTKQAYYPLYETLPQQLLKSWQTTQRTAVQWGVILPKKIMQQIQRIMQQHQNGELIIQANGQVIRPTD